MATYEEMIARAKQLDAAGQTEDAKRLATMAMQMRGSSAVDESMAISDASAKARNELPWGYIGEPGNFRPDVATPSRMGAAARSALQGLTFGYGDEIVGAGQAMLSGTPYETARDFEKERLNRGREAYPWLTTAAEMGGAIMPSMMLGYGALPNAGNAAQRMAVGAGIGGAEGTVYGAGSADPGNRAQGALYGGGLGMGVGAAIPAMTSIGKTFVGRPVATALGVGNAGRGRQAVARALDASGKTGNDIAEYLARADAMGQPAVAADAMGVEGQRALAGAARQPGPGRTAAADFLNQRQVDQGDRVAGILRDAFGMDSYTPMSGGPQTAMAREEATRAARGAAWAINDAAAQAAAGPVNLNSTLGKIDELLRRDPILDGTRDALSEGALGRKLTALRRQLGTDGLQRIDYDAVRNIRTDLRTMMDVNPRTAAQLRPVYEELTRALDEASPKFSTANSLYAAGSREADAIPTGAALNRPGTRSADVSTLFNRMSPSERVAARIGYGDSLLGKVENSAGGVNTARPFTSGRMSGNIDAMADDPRRTLDALARENDMFETRNAITGGSKTSDNLADAAAANGQDVALIANVAAGNTPGAARDIINRVVGGLAGRNEKTREEIVRLLLARDPQTLNQAYQAVTNGGGARNLVEAILRGGARGAAVPRMTN